MIELFYLSRLSMDLPKISIIIPVYNAEKYIGECLESCINQSLKEIEIILVNDCTPDNSIHIVEKFQKNDSRIKIINHKENKRQGGARNTGLQEATGEYIWFVDSDDLINTYACQTLYDYAKKHELEILQFTSCNFTEKNGEKSFEINLLNNPWTKNKVLNPSDKYSNLFGCPNVTPWSYIAKSSLIKKFKFREGVYHEDVDFTLKLFSQCSRFETISYTAYYYRTNPESTTNTTLSEKRLNDMVELCKVLKDYIEKNKYQKGYFVYDSCMDFVRQIKHEMEKNNMVLEHDLLFESRESLSGAMRVCKKVNNFLKHK